ncbi:MAG: dethiobiotin synthase [Planctomycetes bacterium]|nr:dethiobiotin synthase [Planctomycetota bacterium]
MTGGLDDALRRAQGERAARGLARTLELPEQARHDFTSNDTLGLARDPAVIEAGRAALRDYGAGARASRLLGGGSPLDQTLEAAAADWLGAEAALLFPTGYQANLGVVTTLAGEGDVICSDSRNHASLIDACRLSRARTLIFGHADPASLREALEQCSGARRRIILVEGVDSMEGDLPPLKEYEALAREYDAWLVVDEAHAAGVVGPAGAGAWRAAGLSDERLAARIITGGKALGVGGALVVGSATLRQELTDRARAFVFTTGTPPATAGALLAAIEAARASDDLRERLRANAARLAEALSLPAPAAAILPYLVGDNEAAVAIGRSLQSAGFDVRAVRPPTVPPGTARLRIVVHATHTEAVLDELAHRVLEVDVTPEPPQPTAHAAAPLCVVGTDTEVGKTVVSALIARALCRRGPTRYWKPVQTGDDCDTTTVCDLAPEVHADAPAYRFPRPASPHHAAESAGAEIDIERMDAAYEEERARAQGALLLELAGGLLVPLVGGTTNLDWIAKLRPQLVLVARTGLGTLNHTLLSLEALRSRGLKVEALFLVGEEHLDNERTLRELSGVERVYHLPLLEPLDEAALDAWLDSNDLAPLLGPEENATLSSS